MKSETKINKDLLKAKKAITGSAELEAEEAVMTQTIKNMEDIEKEMKEKLSSTNESSTKLKTKKEIISLLREANGLSTTDLSSRIDLSRTRCSEYLNEMKKQEVVEAKREGRKKIYRLAI
ncbi:MAG: winged helix-turn-helix transcriptional regulator [Candidatus Aenigmatarchaeota archaeon]